MKKRTIFGLVWLFVGLIVAPALLAPQDKPADPILTLDRIFGSREFSAERFGPARWMSDGESYTALEPGAEHKTGRDLVLYEAESGKRRVLVAAARLIPAGASEPLPVEDYAWSPDGKVLIIFTHSKRVWRQNTKGDFWTYDIRTGR
ncbi:MAG: S9 family peptidase, partial [Candidatus Aminicenantales bacterium]